MYLPAEQAVMECQEQPAVSHRFSPVQVTAELRVLVRHVEVSKGKVMVAVYDDERNFQKTMLVGSVKDASRRDVEFSFSGLPRGEYSVLVFQDTNGNGKLDRNLLGIPLEPWGCSLSGKQIDGPPTWAATRFTLSADGQPVEIALDRKMVKKVVLV